MPRALQRNTSVDKGKAAARDCHRASSRIPRRAIIHSEGFVTKLPLVNTLITRCRSHGLALSRNRSWLARAASRHAHHTRHADAEVAEPSIFSQRFQICWPMFAESRDSHSYLGVRRLPQRRRAPFPFTLEEKELTRLVKRSVPPPEAPAPQSRDAVVSSLFSSPLRNRGFQVAAVLLGEKTDRCFRNTVEQARAGSRDGFGYNERWGTRGSVSWMHLKKQ